MKTMLLCVCLLLTTAGILPAQWAKQRDSRVSSLRDGKPNLSAPTPRASDGRPDLSGVWMADWTHVTPGFLFVEGTDIPLPPDEDLMEYVCTENNRDVTLYRK